MLEKLEPFFTKHRLFFVISYFILYMMWFEYLELTVTNNYHIMHVELDNLIPFCEYFIIPYAFWPIYIIATLVFFYYNDKKDFFRFCMFLSIGMSLSLLVCTIFHNGTDFRPTIDSTKNWAAYLVSRLYYIDSNTNVFPSIHVLNAIGTHIAIIHSKTLGKKLYMHVSSFIIMLLICISTLCLKQHSVLDVAGGILMAYFVYLFVYSKIPVTVIVRDKDKKKAIA